MSSDCLYEIKKSRNLIFKPLQIAIQNELGNAPYYRLKWMLMRILMWVQDSYHGVPASSRHGQSAAMEFPF